MRSSWPPAPIGSRGRTATQPEPANLPPETLPEEPEQGPLRRCLVTRTQGRREEMLRFVASPDGALIFDPGATLPGRGMWLSASVDVIELAVRRGVFARAARAPLKLPESLHKVVEAVLARRLSDLLGLARRSGAAISGFEKAREWLQASKGGLIVQAADGSVEERARFVGGRAVPCVAVLSAAALGKIFGREHTVHVVILPGRWAQMIELEARRLLGVAKESVSGQ